jgi:peptidoglycan hydrolase CwlO-like protein
MNSQLNLEERRANSNSQNSESLRIQLERVTSNKNRIEQIVSSLNHEISDIETKVYRISVEINQTQEELTNIEK